MRGPVVQAVYFPPSQVIHLVYLLQVVSWASAGVFLKVGQRLLIGNVIVRHVIVAVLVVTIFLIL